MKRRDLFRALYAPLLSAGVADASALNSPFPSRPIRILVGSAPGALVDVAARLYAGKMSDHLGQPVIVENVAGASSLLAMRQLLKSAPDGYTLLVAANTLVTVSHVNLKAGYTVAELSAIGEMARSPVLLVTRGSAPYRTLRDLLEDAARNPESLTYGSSGIATTNHLAVELLARQAKVSFSHVPYKGISAAVPDVLSGRVTFLMGTPTSVVELMKTGALRALAISSKSRSRQFPDLPTLSELGYPGATFEVWIGTVAPKGIAPTTRNRLGQAMEAARNDPELAGHLARAGQEISGIRTPDQFANMLLDDDRHMKQLVKAARIMAE